MCKDHNNRKGESLAHGQKEHNSDHSKWSRRNFLYSLGVMGGGTVTLAGLPVSSLGMSSLSAAGGAANGDGRILVMIRLKGGNDGLNTIIPTFDYGTYAANRPTIAVEQSDITQLTDKFGIPSIMDPLKGLWDTGQMKVVNSVGYEDPNLSHFESIDIWSSGTRSNDPARSGWLGRTYVNQYPDYLENPSPIPPAVKIGGPDSILFFDDNGADLGFNVGNAAEIDAIGDSGTVFSLDVIDNECYYGDQVEFLRTMANSTYRYVDVISEAFQQGSNAVEYSGELGEQLSIVSRMIKGNLGTQLYLVTLNGFDTHVNQTNNHSNLMNDLSQSIAAFYEDLGIDGLDNDVLTMTFSEFGRRVQQNASDGTDHGTAAPVLLFGPGLNGEGILGDDPDLSDLDNSGNLKYGTDFRSLYSSILEYWLCIDPSAVDDILGEAYPRMDIGLQCSPISSTSAPVQQTIAHSAYQSQNLLNIKVQLNRPDQIKVDLYTILGQHLAVVHNGYVSAGPHTFNTPVGQYGKIPVFYRITNGQTQLTGKVVLR